MEQLIKFKSLESEFSTFRISLIKHHCGELYINIQQTTKNASHVGELKINPSVLPNILYLLNIYNDQLSGKTAPRSPKKYRKEKYEQIIRSYFIGVPLEALAMQFDCSVEMITQILLVNDIPIVDNRLTGRKRCRRGNR